MNRTNRIAVIIEGAKLEKSIIKNLQECLFGDDNKVEYMILSLPLEGTVYQLWNELKDDDDLDIIELIREYDQKARKLLDGYDRNSFSEVFLFFDYDAHQQNLNESVDASDVLLDMLTLFDNETENGKLYISYPMGEALRDCVLGCCKPFSGSCHYDRMVGRKYKTISSNNNPLSHISSLTITEWMDIINIYRGRLSCVFDRKLMSILDCKDVSPVDIFTKQNDSDEIMVLSGFPEFLIDYFPEEYLNSKLESRGFSYLNGKCEF